MNDGGPAFPCKGIEYDPDFPGALQSVSYSGMSLRDWFAGMAMQGQIIADQRAADNPEKAAERAYANADAMIKEREK